MLVARDPIPNRVAQRSQARPLSSERVFCRRRALASALRAVIVAALLAVAGAPIAAAQDATPVADGPVERAATWLLAQRNDEGAFLGFDGNPDPGATADAIIALAAARDAGVAVDLAPSVAYLESQALVYAQTGAGQAAKLVLATVAAGGDPRDIATVDPVSLIEHSLDPVTGLYGFGVFDHALVMLALDAAGVEIPAEAVTTLKALQIDDGSWSWDASSSGNAGDTNTTAIVVQALVAAGAGESEAASRAVAYLLETQLEGGGFTYQPIEGAVADANSTGIVILALFAAGVDPADAELMAATAALLALQNESGAFVYTADPPDDNLFATLQALPAIASLAATLALDATPAAA